MEVKLRERKGKKKTALNLAIWEPQGRKWRIEPLKLYLYPGRDRKAQNDETLALAKTIQAKRQAELQSGEYGLVADHKRKGDFILFFENLANEKDGNWRHAAKILKQYSPQPVAFQSMNENWILDFQKFLLKKFSQNTAWLLITKIRAGIKIALRKGFIRNNFLEKINPNEKIHFKQNKRTFLTADEIQRLFNTPCSNQDLQRAFMFSIFTGLRYSDICALTWRNIEKDFISLTVKKTDESERLPLNKSAKKILFDRDEKIIQMEPEQKVFKMLAPSSTNTALEIWARKAGIKKHLTFHVGRHTYAFLLLTSGIGLYDVSKALGHKSINMTLIYAHSLPAELKQRIDDKLPSFDLERGAK